MTTLTLPDSTRIIDLVKLANSQGKRLRWRARGFDFVPYLEDVTDVSNSRTRSSRPRTGWRTDEPALPAHLHHHRRQPAHHPRTAGIPHAAG